MIRSQSIVDAFSNGYLSVYGQNIVTMMEVIFTLLLIDLTTSENMLRLRFNLIGIETIQPLL